MRSFKGRSEEKEAFGGSLCTPFLSIETAIHSRLWSSLSWCWSSVASGMSESCARSWWSKSLANKITPTRVWVELTEWFCFTWKVASATDLESCGRVSFFFLLRISPYRNKRIIQDLSSGPFVSHPATNSQFRTPSLSVDWPTWCRNWVPHENWFQ